MSKEIILCISVMGILLSQEERLIPTCDNQGATLICDLLYWFF